MNGNEEDQLPRPRPLSGGIWTLFSWLRRSERSSSESISSVGSDRTVASFDFLEPTEYGIGLPPLILPENHPTDTYKKRLFDREVRRQRERDITIHRKYGLLKFGGYETFSHTSSYAIKSSTGTNRKFCRASSECYPPSPRAAYVPGKRRAPQPPSLVVSATLPRYKRKRRAPKPPSLLLENNKENCEQTEKMQVNKHMVNDKHDLQLKDSVTVNVQKHVSVTQEEKVSRDKSFFKQLFENKKRNSAIDTSHVKLLPSISELDKQAYEIIEINKAFKASMENRVESKSLLDNPWICTKCLRKYQASVSDCLYCKNHQLNKKEESTRAISNNTPSNVDILVQRPKNVADDKEKLKEMLKEMKNSLPKRSKQNISKEHVENSNFSESSTLRIGTGSSNIVQPSTSSESSNVNIHISKILNDCKVKEVFLNPNLVPYNSDKLSQEPINISNKAQEKKQVTEITSKNFISVNSNLSKNNNQHGISKVTTASTKVSMVFKNEKEISCNFAKVQDLSANHSNVPQINLQSHVENNKEIHPNPHSVNSANIDKTTNINLPLRISALLNPIESGNNILVKNTPINNSSKCNINKGKDPVLETSKNEKFISKQNECRNEDMPSTSKEIKCTDIIIPLKPAPASCSSNKYCTKQKDFHNSTSNSYVQNKDIGLSLASYNLEEQKCDKINLEILNQHSRRRTLVNTLEQSISKGDEATAAKAAAELAKLRLSCSVLSFSSQIAGVNSAVTLNSEQSAITSSPIESSVPKGLKPQIPKRGKEVGDAQVKDSLKVINKTDNNKILEVKNEHDDVPTKKPTDDLIPIQVWVEDKDAARGPLRLSVRRNARMADLMQQAQISLGLNIELQRWIVGRNLCTDDKVMLSALAGDDLLAPFYLCLVEPGSKNILPKIDDKTYTKEAVMEKNDDKSGEVYKELMKLEKTAIVPNPEEFECEVCMEQCARGDGIILRECIHMFCKSCLTDAVRHCEEPVVSCPAVGCMGSLQDREIRALLNLEEYERWLAQSLTTAECGTRNTFHCRTTDCTGWAFCETGVRRFPCPVCKHTNCIPCQALHEGESCEQYQQKLKKAVAVGEDNKVDEGTRAFLNTLIRRGEAIECPECNAIITKKWGCDWVKCSACKTEICWVTKGRRWGPAGKGDISGGCRCGVEGKRCHPTCGYCH